MLNLANNKPQSGQSLICSEQDGSFPNVNLVTEEQQWKNPDFCWADLIISCQDRCQMFFLCETWNRGSESAALRHRPFQAKRAFLELKVLRRVS